MKGATRRSGTKNGQEWPYATLSWRVNEETLLDLDRKAACVCVRSWVAWSRDLRVWGRYLNTVCMGKASFVDQYAKGVSVQSQEKISVLKTPYRTEIFRIASKLVCNKVYHVQLDCAVLLKECVLYIIIYSQTHTRTRTHTHTHTHTHRYLLLTLTLVQSV